MKEMLLDRVRGWPPRQVWIGALIIVALALSATAAISRGPFDALVLLATLPGLLSFVLLLFPARPRLEVKLRGDTETAERMTIGAGLVVRPIDKEAIVEEQVRAAFETMPRMPVPSAVSGSPLAEALAPISTAAALHASVSGVSEESLHEFEAEVETYRRDLRRWLDALEHARAERHREFLGAIRVAECGSRAADHVRLRLRFPSGFEPAKVPAIVDQPPSPPRFSKWGFPSPILDVPRSPLPYLNPLPLGSDPVEWQYSRDGNAVVAECDLGRVNQDDFRDTSQYELRAAPPGVYELEWEASADGLRRVARGRLHLEIAEPDAGTPIVTLAEAEAEAERYDLD